MPPTVEGIGLLFLLPFCSHNTPKQGGTRRRTTHHQTTWNRLLPNAFPARSEGYRTWQCCTHNPKVAGSNPAPATIDNEGLADASPLTPFALPRLHPGIGLCDWCVRQERALFFTAACRKSCPQEGAQPLEQRMVSRRKEIAV